jgi:hypothetical protein
VGRRRVPAVGDARRGETGDTSYFERVTFSTFGPVDNGSQHLATSFEVNTELESTNYGILENTYLTENASTVACTPTATPSRRSPTPRPVPAPG